ncbi:hypothetical protein RJ641_005737 [Dillenia turbinata]|uniref:HMA domain-containing protein n=1 Tax=Dillenia turbinata TaxID=194707 RepID=A0AAN8VLG7_9MAGN
MCADIESYKVDRQLNNVTVKGNVTNEEVMRVIRKIGKTASNWDASDGEEVKFNSSSSNK